MTVITTSRDVNYRQLLKKSKSEIITEYLSFLETNVPRPIATAPKDGRPFFGWMPSYHQGKGRWSVVLWMEGEWWDMKVHPTKPSHWLPMPDAPKVVTKTVLEFEGERHELR